MIKAVFLPHGWVWARELWVTLSPWLSLGASIFSFYPPSCDLLISITLCPTHTGQECDQASWTNDKSGVEASYNKIKLPHVFIIWNFSLHLKFEQLHVGFSIRPPDISLRDKIYLDKIVSPLCAAYCRVIDCTCRGMGCIIVWVWWLLLCCWSELLSLPTGDWEPDTVHSILVGNHNTELSKY